VTPSGDSSSHHKVGRLEEEVGRLLAELIREIEDAIGAGQHENVCAQLQAVSASIQKLSGKGVPVPDELRALKSSLLSQESALGEVVASRLRLAKEFANVIRRLGVPEALVQPHRTNRKTRKADDEKQRVLDLFDYQQGNG
jgi:hypothetical protein